MEISRFKIEMQDYLDEHFVFEDIYEPMIHNDSQGLYFYLYRNPYSLEKIPKETLPSYTWAASAHTLSPSLLQSWKDDLEATFDQIVELKDSLEVDEEKEFMERVLGTHPEVKEIWWKFQRFTNILDEFLGEYMIHRGLGNKEKALKCKKDFLFRIIEDL